MKDSKKMSEVCEKVYMEELEHFIKDLEEYYDGNNKEEMPLLMVLPHEYGVAVTRILPDSIQRQAEIGKPDISDVAGPLASAIAQILEIPTCREVFRGTELRAQKVKESIAYEVLTVLLAQVLANGRAEDFLGVGDGDDMQRAIEIVKNNDDEEDDEEDGEEEGGGDTCDLCMHTKHGTRAYALDLSNLSIKGLSELTELLSRNEKDDSDATAELFEKFMQKHGAKRLSENECKELGNKIKNRGNKCGHSTKKGKK